MKNRKLTKKIDQKSHLDRTFDTYHKKFGKQISKIVISYIKYELTKNTLKTASKKQIISGEIDFNYSQL